ncbi:MAG TPA: DUF58 domain-containing protein [Thermomicrobiales bacterium]|nr:DUF58 domain-containing protein [Thermomicrobiales bacterium]
MFFNAIWIYGALVVLVVGMAIRQPALTVLGTLVLLTAGVSWGWSRWALRAVGYRRRLASARVFQDETVTLTLELVNRKPLPLAWIDVDDQIPDRVEVTDRRVAPSEHPTRAALPYLTSLRPYERVAWTATLRCPYRGFFVFGPARLRSGDIFGFFTRAADLPAEDTLLVYPRIIPLPELGIPPRQAFGEIRAPHALLLDPLRAVGVRDYRPEDSFRHIHWKATARAQELQVRVFEPTTVTQLGIFVNLDTFQHYWEGLDTVHSEAAIVAAASLAAHAVHERYAVGLYGNGLVGGSDQPLRLAPGGGPAQLTRALEGLAKLSPFATLDFPKFLRDETRGFPWGSTIVVISAVMTPPLAATLATLRDAGHRLVLVAVDEFVAPSLRGLTVHRLPDDLLLAERLRQRAAEPDGAAPAREAAR